MLTDVINPNMFSIEFKSKEEVASRIRSHDKSQNSPASMSRSIQGMEFLPLTSECSYL